MNKKQERIKKLVQLANTLNMHTDNKGELRLSKHDTEVVAKHVQTMLDTEGCFIVTT